MTLSVIRKKLDTPYHILERIVRQYKPSAKTITKGKRICNTYDVTELKRIIEAEKNIKPAPEGMSLIYEIRHKYSLNSVDWPSIYNLPDAPKPKCKAFDKTKKLRNYYCDKEWDEYLSKLKSAGHPMLVGKSKIKGETKQVRVIEKENEVYIHPERQKAYQQAANARLLNKAFMVMQ